MNDSNDSLSGGSIVVSGGAAGAGRTIARAFATQGARVAICDIDTNAVSTFCKENPDIAGFVADAGSAQAVDTFFGEVEKAQGSVDVVINNVGIAGPTSAVENITDDEWQQSLNANLSSHFLFARRAIPTMKRHKRGLIINISSASARTGLPLRLPYVVTKAAVISMAKNLARELGPYGIRVNAILPGAIRGPRLQRIISEKASMLGISTSEYERSLLRFISLRTMVDADDIAAMAIFLASASGAKITGQAIGVDGNLEYEE